MALGGHGLGCVVWFDEYVEVASAGAYFVTPLPVGKAAHGVSQSSANVVNRSSASRECPHVRHRVLQAAARAPGPRPRRLACHTTLQLRHKPQIRIVVENLYLGYRKACQ